MIVPLGFAPGFNVRHEMYVVAGHYGVALTSLKQQRPRHEQVQLARDALFWRLTVHCNLPAQRAGQMLGVGETAAREAAARHAQRIAEFSASINARAPKVQTPKVHT